MSQVAFFGLLLVCIALHPGYLFSHDEGGISNYGVHAETVAPYTGALGLAAMLVVAAARSVRAPDPVARRFAGGLVSFGVLLALVLASTYPYQHGVALRDVHFAVGTAAICFEAVAACWLVAKVRAEPPDVAACAVELAGVVLAACTVAGVVHLLFASQLVTSGAFGVLLVRSATALRDAPAR
jgi:hypothetical protein